jgi:hypothetical protein
MLANLLWRAAFPALVFLLGGPALAPSGQFLG